MAAGDFFGIHELPLCGGGVRLMLVGELDLAAAPVLEQRLEQLRIQREQVLLDLSRLDFIDSSGLRVLIVAWNDAQHGRRSFAIDRNLSSQATQLFELVGATHMLVSEQATER